MNDYILRPTRPDDLTAILDIIKEAQEQFSIAGIDQWQDGYPNKTVFLRDISNGHSFVLTQNNEIIATVMISFDGEPTYASIEGNWLSDTAYAVIHRLAVKNNLKGKGIAGYIIAQVEKQCHSRNVDSIRIDTHSDNLAMQRTASKRGFRYCGIITLASGAKRLAYEKTADRP